MLDDASRPFSREELLEGLPNRRASLLLFSIEGQTAYLVAQARQAMADFLPPGTAEEREQAFLEALARRRELPLRPTIQDLERYAPHWAALVPANPRLRAALAQRLGQKYCFARDDVPSLRAALAPRRAGGPAGAAAAVLDRVRADAHRHGRGQHPGAADRAGGDRAAGRGGAARGARAGQPGDDRRALGGGGAQRQHAPSASVLPAYGARLPRRRRGERVHRGAAGAGLLRADGLLRRDLHHARQRDRRARRGLDGAAVPGQPRLPAPRDAQRHGRVGAGGRRRQPAPDPDAVGARARAGTARLPAAAARPGGRRAGGGSLRARAVVRGHAGGAVRHLATGNGARVVLQRDPRGRALIWGNLAASATALGLFCVWVLAVNGALAPGALSGQAGTALVPLAAVAGPAVYLVGGVYVALAMGMSSIHKSLALFNQVQGWLPGHGRPPSARLLQRVA